MQALKLTAVVLVTHGRVGQDMVMAVESFLHMHIPMLVAVGLEPGDDRQRVSQKIDEAVNSLGLADAEAEDVLFLVDLVGSTPARLCCRKCRGTAHVVTGVNMPMLLKLATADRGRGPVALGQDLVATGTKSIHCE